MIHTFNEIAALPPAEVGVHNVNELIMHEYSLDDFLQIQHDGNDHGQDYDMNIPHLEIHPKYYLYPGTITKMYV